MATTEMSRCLSRCLSQRDTIGTPWNSSKSVQMSLWDKTRDVLHQSQSQSQSQSPFLYLARACCFQDSYFQSFVTQRAREQNRDCTWSTAGADAHCLGSDNPPTPRGGNDAGQ